MDGEKQVLDRLAEDVEEGFCISIIIHGELEYMVSRLSTASRIVSGSLIS